MREEGGEGVADHAGLPGKPWRVAAAFPCAFSPAKATGNHNDSFAIDPNMWRQRHR